jgi:hypothetical protein
MKLKLTIELVWWCFTALLVVAVLYPIYSQVTDYPYYTINAICIATFITLGRYIFLLKYTFLSHIQYVKAALMVACIPFIFYLIDSISGFQHTLDSYGYELLVRGVPFERQANMGSYIRSEYLFFAVGAVITTFIFPFRMLMSIWRQINTDDTI